MHDDSLYNTAHREIFEELGIKLLHLQQLPSRIISTMIGRTCYSVHFFISQYEGEPMRNVHRSLIRVTATQLADPKNTFYSHQDTGLTVSNHLMTRYLLRDVHKYAKQHKIET